MNTTYTLTLCLNDGRLESYPVRPNTKQQAYAWAALICANYPRVTTVTVEASRWAL